MDKVAFNLSNSIRFKTVSHQEEACIETAAFIAFHDFLEESYPLIHCTLKRERVGGLSLLYTWEGTDKEASPLVFAAHMDVVPIEDGTLENWAYPPFEGRIADGYIWGRGTMDCKGILIALMEAVEGLLDQGYRPRPTVYLAFGHDEEVGGYKGACEIAKLLASRRVQAECVLDEGGFLVDGEVLGVRRPIASIGIAEKGYLTLELRVETEGGHSSLPPAHTAIGILARAIHRLEGKPFPSRLDGTIRQTFQYLAPELPRTMRLALANRWLMGGLVKHKLSKITAANAMIRTTFAATIIRGGTKENVLPQEARAVMNFRVLPGDSIEYVVGRVKKIVNDPVVSLHIRGHPTEASGVSDMDSKGFRILERTLKEVFKEAVPAPFLVTGMSDARHYACISNRIFRFGPQRVGLDDEKRGHGTDEQVGVENFREFVTFYTRMIQNTG